MKQERLSKLQKTILLVLSAKDHHKRITIQKNLPERLPPYWHRTRDTRESREVILEDGIKNAVRTHLKSVKNTNLFHNSFSRSLKSLITKGFVEAKREPKKRYGLKSVITHVRLTEKGKETIARNTMVLEILRVVNDKYTDRQNHELGS